MIKAKILMLIAAVASISLAIVGCEGPSGQAQAQTGATSSTSATSAPTTTPATTVNYVGKFSLTPDHGAIGSTVSAAGSGFEPNATLQVVWQGFEGGWKVSDGNYDGRDFTSVMQPLTNVKTDANGDFQTSFTIPDGFGFDHNVMVEGQNVVENQANFSVDMQVSISPSSGPPGTPITFSAQGIGWRAMENSWEVIYDNKFTGLMSSVTTNGTATFSIPATGIPGKHIIQILHGAATYPFLNMQQSPDPTRPTWTFEFTITDGTAVTPPPGPDQSFPAESGSGKPSTAGPALWTDLVQTTVGTPVTLYGSALPAGKHLDVVWVTMKGSRVSGGGYAQDLVTLGTVTTANDGSFTFPFNMPDDLGGSHQIEVQSAGTSLAQTSVTITPSAFAISDSSGPDGTTFTIHLKGVSWTETANNYYVDYDNGYEGYVCGFNAQGDVTLHMSATGGPGWHYIDLYPGIYKGTDMAYTDDFRIPQLTALQDHPGEHLPVFHFAFQVTP